MTTSMMMMMMMMMKVVLLLTMSGKVASTGRKVDTCERQSYCVQLYSLECTDTCNADGDDSSYKLCTLRSVCSLCRV